jgi:NAD(P)-dependent dehydrogenase (short-subunit alcohol dehydrogenase family)
MATVVITGAGKGLGQELSLQLAARGDHVIATVRDAADRVRLPDIEVHSGIDVTSDLAATKLAEAVSGRSVDVLINNAGIFIPDNGVAIDYEAAVRQFSVNALGPVRITRAISPNLRVGSKIVMVTSVSGSIASASRHDHIGYRMSKTALNMATKVIANGLRDRGITVICIHPGSISTRMNPNGLLQPEQAAKVLISLIDRACLKMSGRFLEADGREINW